MFLAPSARAANSLLLLPLSTRCRAVRFHVRGVDQLRVGGSCSRKLPEQVFPDAPPCPAHDARRIPVSLPKTNQDCIVRAEKLMSSDPSPRSGSQRIDRAAGSAFADLVCCPATPYSASAMRACRSEADDGAWPDPSKAPSEVGLRRLSAVPRKWMRS
jgi:hypothetical protein